MGISQKFLSFVWVAGGEEIPCFDREGTHLRGRGQKCLSSLGQDLYQGPGQVENLPPPGLKSSQGLVSHLR